MKANIIPLFILMILAAVLLNGCAGTVQTQSYVPSRYVDVYINEECMPSTLAKGGLIETLWVFPGDQLVIVNTRETKLEIKFPDGMFDQDAAVIGPGKRVILKVLNVSSKTGVFTFPDKVCPDGIPKVRVGEEP